MGTTTPTQSLRYAYVTDVISHTASKDLADDVAAQLDAADVARTAALKRPIAKARRTAAQSIVDSSFVTVTFDTEVWDTHAMIDIAGQPTRITCGATAGIGIYLVRARVNTIAGTGFTRSDIGILKNGVVKHQNEQWGAVTDEMYCAGHVALGATTDFLTMTIRHIGGGTINASFIELTAQKIANL